MNRLMTLPSNLRRHAKRADSRTIDVIFRRTLQAAADGREVDMYDLNIACFAAMRTVATRGSQSPSRRELATDIWYLALHVADILEGREPKPVEKPRQPVEYSPDELQDWLKV